MPQCKSQYHDTQDCTNFEGPLNSSPHSCSLEIEEYTHTKKMPLDLQFAHSYLGEARALNTCLLSTVIPESKIKGGKSGLEIFPQPTSNLRNNEVKS
jgi:hypothetical protein